VPRNCARTRLTRVRQLATSAVRRAEAEAAPAVVKPAPPQKRPVGGFRGGLFGFFLGFSIASGFASYHLLDEYKLASATLERSVAELQESTMKVSQHVRRIEAVEKEVKALAERSASREETSKVRNEMKKLFDSLHIEFLDLKAHVAGMQQDLHSVTQSTKDSTKQPRI